MFFSPFSIAITSLGEERANLSDFRTFVWFVFVWICRFPLLLGAWEGLRFVIVALPGLFSYLFLLGLETLPHANRLDCFRGQRTSFVRLYMCCPHFAIRQNLSVWIPLTRVV